MARKTNRKPARKSNRKSTKSPVDVYQMITDAIIEHLDNGTVPWRKPWTGGSDAAPRNIRGTGYRGINVWLLVAAQVAGGYDANTWLTYKQAEAKGTPVRKGESSTVVAFWKLLNVDDENDDGTTTSRKIPMLRYYRVFNVEQCTGYVKPDATDESKDEFEPIAECEALVASYADAPAVKHGGGRACYSPSYDEIRMPEASKFNTPAEYHSTLFHEFAHSTGHGNRLDRDEITRAGITFGDHAYSKEELTAEFAAAFLCGVAGIETATIENSAAYIANWKKTLKGDNKLVVQAAQRAQKAADYIRGLNAKSNATAEAA